MGANIDHSKVGSFAKNCGCCRPNAVGMPSFCGNVSDTTRQSNLKLLPFVETSCELSSVRGIIDGIRNSESQYLSQMFKNLTFVGVVNENYSVVQVYLKSLR